MQTPGDLLKMQALTMALEQRSENLNFATLAATILRSKNLTQLTKKQLSSEDLVSLSRPRSKEFS